MRLFNFIPFKDRRLWTFVKISNLALNVLLAICFVFPPQVSAELIDETAQRLAPIEDDSFDAKFADEDGDNDLDISAGSAGRNRLHVNENAIFNDASNKLPTNSDHTIDVEFADVDNDGDLDIFCANAGRNRLYIKDASGNYVDESNTRLPSNPPLKDNSFDAKFVDVDQDRDPDIFIANVGARNRLLINDGSGVFTDQTQVRLPANVDDSYGVDAADINGDAMPDIIIANAGGRNTLLMNDGSGGYDDESNARLPYDADVSFDVDFGDLDGDNDLDIFVTNGLSENKILLNNGAGVFADATAGRLPHSPNEASIRSELADVNGDGFLDIMTARAGQDRLYFNNGSGVFTDATDTHLGVDNSRTFGLSFGDIDGDVDMDVILAKPGAQNRLLVNKPDVVGPVVSVRAEPTEVNVGQEVLITVDARDNLRIAELTLQVEGQPVALDANNQARYTPTTPKGYNVEVRAKDAAGHETTANTAFTAIPDTTNPVVTVTVDNNQIFLGQSVLITVEATDNVGIASLNVDVNGQNVVLDQNNQVVYTPPADGNFTVTATGQDAAGNSDTDTADFTVVLDTIAPNVTVTANPGVVNIGAPVTLTVDATDNVGVTFLDLKVDGMALQLDQNNQAVFTPMAPQVYTATATARDAAGNETMGDADFEATPDTLPPVVTLDINPQKVQVFGQTTLTVTATDNIGVVSTALEIDGQDIPLTNNQATVVLQDARVFVAKGIADDAAGNRGEKEDYIISFDPSDNTAPSVVGVNPDDGATGVQVDSAIVIDFNETIDPRTVTTNTFTVTDDGGPIPGSISFANNFARAIFTPASDLTLSSDYEVRLSGGAGGVSDLRGNVLPADFSSTFMTVDPAQIPPEVTVTVDPESVEVGNPVEVTVTATDNIGVASLSLEIDGEDVPLDQDGRAFYTPTMARAYVAIGKAIDTDGNEGTGAANFSATFSGQDDTWPTVEITSPPDDSEITHKVDIIGTANDDNLVSYKLEYSVKDENSFFTFATGASPVVNGVLGSFDPTMLMNDIFTIRLTATDVVGHTVSTVVTYRITGGLKLGHFTVSFEDLRLPLSGIPISIIRTYDTRDKRKRDFGVGWSLQIKTVEIKENRRPGDGWTAAPQGGFVPTYSLQPIGDHYVIANAGPDWEGFAFTPRLQSPLFPTFAVAGFTPLPRITSRLDPIGGRDLVFNGGQLFDLDFNVYDPDNYLVTTISGLRLTINQPDGLRQLTDANNNSITITSNGVIHSSGASITFGRDGSGRITRITDPVGNFLSYEYDARGDLVAFADRMSNRTTYEYDDNHYLIKVIDPEGRVITNLYDEEGRRALATMPSGNVTRFTYDVDGKTQTLVDDSGAQVTLEGDEEGRIRFVTDPLGNVTENAYDANGNLISRIDPLGNQTDYTYDQTGNVTSVTDALGRTTSYTYNAAGQLLTTTDAKGNVTTNTYDNRGNLTAVTDPLGNVTTVAYDNIGNPSSFTSANGDTFHLDNTAEGYTRKLVGPRGGVQHFDFDGLGNVTSHKITRHTDNGDVEVEMRRAYNANGIISQMTDPLGNSSHLTYDGLSRVKGVITPRGNTTSKLYNENGFTTGLLLPNGTELTKQVDFRGLVTERTNASGGKTQMSYDLAGRRIKTTFADGSFETYTRDPLGRVTSITSANGLTVNKTYDAVGNVISVDFEGEVTTFKYDELNRVIEETDANGNTARREYNAGGLLTKIIFADGTFVEYEYDEEGNRISQTDQLGRTTRFEYDSLAQITKVTDPLGNETTFTYDDFIPGLLKTITDANGNTTRFEYDNRGALVKTTLPMGQTSSRTYDSEGNMITLTDFNGETFRFEYDEMNRLKAKILPDGGRVEFDRNLLGGYKKVSDPSGESAFDYDELTRLNRYIGPDGREVHYSYDSANNLTEVITPLGTTSYTYDNHNRISTVTDNNGGITQYTYDNTGNLISTLFPNGNVTTHTYDILNRVTSIVTRDSNNNVVLSFDYERDAVGNVTRVVENSGRIIDYQYDALDRLVREDIQDPVLGNETIEYTYDAVGNRLTKTDSSGTIFYTYDGNGRLLSAGNTTYTYDNNGNVLTVTRPGTTVSYYYDFENRLIRVERNDNGNVSVASYTYDYDGIRLSQNVNGTETKFLLDKLARYPVVLAEYDSSENVVAEYTYAGGILSRTAGGVTHYFHADLNGSIRALSQADGLLSDTYVYSSFGELTDHRGASDNPLLYTGEYLDEVSDLVYLRARRYAPGVGRFIQKDPLMGDPLSPQTMNRYIYALNNPIVNTDPSGLWTLVGMMQTIATIGFLIAKFFAVVGAAGFFVGSILTGHLFETLREKGFLWENFRAYRIALSGGAEFGAPQFVTSFGVVGALEALYYPDTLWKVAGGGGAVGLGSFGWQFYVSFGLSSTWNLLPLGSHASLGWGIDLGMVYQVFDPEDYIGPFIGMSINVGEVVRNLLGKSPWAGRVLKIATRGVGASFFSSPTSFQRQSPQGGFQVVGMTHGWTIRAFGNPGVSLSAGAGWAWILDANTWGRLTQWWEEEKLKWVWGKIKGLIPDVSKLPNWKGK